MSVADLMEDEEEEEEDGAAADVDAQRKGVSAVIKTSTRQTIFLPIPGLVDVKELKPGDLVGTNKVCFHSWAVGCGLGGCSAARLLDR